jgi:hypothetical protein
MRYLADFYVHRCLGATGRTSRGSGAGGSVDDDGPCGDNDSRLSGSHGEALGIAHQCRLSYARETWIQANVTLPPVDFYATAKAYNS